MARATALTRNRGRAARSLLDAERLAPEEVRRPSVAELVADLIELAPSLSDDLTGLATRCGVRA